MSINLFTTTECRSDARLSVGAACLLMWALLVPVAWPLSPVHAEDKPATAVDVKLQVTGLFSSDRVADLQRTVEAIPEIELVSVDFDTAEAVFRYDSAKTFQNAKPDQIIEQLDNLVKPASRYTFGIKSLCKIPRDKLKRIEIPIVGLDCKACCLAVYETVYKLEGVEQATASFKQGLVTAWIDPEKTAPEKLEEALIQRNVTLKNRAAAP